MPIRFACPSCKNTLTVAENMAGKKGKCKCGAVIRIPQPKASQSAAGSNLGSGASSSAGKTSGSGKIAVQCTCGRKLQAPATAAGKRVKCKCGKVLDVPASSAVPAPQPAASDGPFQFLSASDWADLAPPEPKEPEYPALEDEEKKAKPKSSVQEMLERAATGSGQGKRPAKESSNTNLNSSRGILIGLGCFKLCIALYHYWLISSMVEAISKASPDADASDIELVVKIICGTEMGIAALFIIFGALLFLFPMTMSISAMVLFVCLEVFSLVLNPFGLLSIPGWIIRIAIGGALLQAINNASYLRFIRKKGPKA